MTRAMSQILHIFRKDVRHHWPELLVSLLLLAAFVWYESTQWSGYPQTFNPFHILLSFVNFLLPLSWCLLIVRLIQQESLVGDRQFWVTRPYEWPSLLFSKLFFLLIFIHVPLFVAQCILLKLAGFPVTPHIAGLFDMQIGLGFLFLAPLTLAVMTRSLAQALLVAIGVFLVLLAVGPLISLVPNHGISGALEDNGYFQGFLLLAAPIAVIFWQYTRRRTAPSRGILLGAAALMVLADVVTPYRALLEKQYPLSDSSHPAPVQFSVLPPPPPPKNLPPSPPTLPSEVLISIPVRVSSVSDGSVVRANGILAFLEAPGNLKWDSDWNPLWTEFWPEQTFSTLQFSIKRRLFESIKSLPVHLRLSLALSQFKESSPRELLLPENQFFLIGVGHCRLWPGYFPALNCRSALNLVPLIVSSTITNASCSDQDSAPSSRSNYPAHELRGTQIGGFVNPGISPIKTFSISLQTFAETKESPEERARLHLCPGTPIRFATPVHSVRTRLNLEIDHIKLEDYEAKTYGSFSMRAVGVSSIELR